MLIDILPDYLKAAPNAGDYEFLRTYTYDTHQVAWTRHTRSTANGVFLSTYALVCDCDFVEGVGWLYDPKYQQPYTTEETAYLVKYCDYRQRAIRERHNELRMLCDIPADGSQVSEKKAYESLRTLVSLAAAHEMIGEEYPSIYFSFKTYTTIIPMSIEVALKTAKNAYDDKIACYNGCDIVPYEDPVWIIIKPERMIFTNPSVILDGSLGVPAHSNMPQHFRIEVKSSDNRVHVVDTSTPIPSFASCKSGGGMPARSESLLTEAMEKARRKIIP